jgi:hypothetical protein
MTLVNTVLIRSTLRPLQNEHNATIDTVKHVVDKLTLICGNAFPNNNPTLDNCATSVNTIKERKAKPVRNPAVLP